jgi:hypothetical protein
MPLPEEFISPTLRYLSVKSVPNIIILCSSVNQTVAVKASDGDKSGAQHPHPSCIMMRRELESVAHSFFT